MRLRPSLLCALWLLAPAAAGAQLAPRPAPPRASVTAFTGARVPFTTGDVAAFDLESGERLFTAREDRSGGPLLGVEATVRLAGPVSLVGGAIYSQGGTGDFFLDRDTAGAAPALRVGYLFDTWLAKLGGQLRVSSPALPGEDRPRPSTDFVVAGAVVRQFDTTHPALNLGFQGAFPLRGTRAALVVGVEDYLVFWDEGALAPAMAAILGRVDGGGDPLGAEMLYGASNLLALRLGVSVGF